MLSTLYLYSTHDADLVGLFEAVGKKDFGNILKDSLRILTRPGYIPKVSIPKYKHYEGEYRRISMPVSIQSKKDEDIRELISHIKYRQFNGFCKMAMRFYLGVIPTMSSMLDTELIKTIPVYTPSGVIVFSNSISTNTPKRTTKERTNTITRANKRIQETIAETTTQKIEPIQNVSTDTDINTSFNMEEDFTNDTVNDDIDVLSLLEGLLD